MITNFLPSYSFGGDEVYKEVGEIVKPYGKKICIIGGKTALSKVLPVLRPILKESGFEILDEIVYGKECTYEKGQELAKLPAVQDADVLFAIGGGKAIDTVKLVSYYAQEKIFFAFPTIAATCAATSKVAAVYDAEHVFVGAHYNPHPARHIFINARILVEAPERYIWAGMGDTIAKCYESELSSRNYEATYEGQLGVAIATMCAKPVKKYGVEAMNAARQQVRNDAFDQMALAVIFTTGLASNFLEENLNSSMAHAMCYGFTTQKIVEKNHLHGEIVSYGVLVLLTADQQIAERNLWIDIYKKMGLPTKLADLEMNMEQMEPVFAKALAVNDIVVAPYKITKDMLYNAVLELENL